jgi:hypothetical protein
VKLLATLMPKEMQYEFLALVTSLVLDAWLCVWDKTQVLSLEEEMDGPSGILQFGLLNQYRDCGTGTSVNVQLDDLLFFLILKKQYP